MFKKIIPIAFSIIIMSSLALFSQEKSTEDKEAKSAEALKLVSGEVKTYNDGFNTYVNANGLFRLSARDNVQDDKIFYQINKGDKQEYSQPFTIKEEGRYIITYYSVDKFGNQEVPSKDFKIIVDTTPPSVSVFTNKAIIQRDGKLYASKMYQYTLKANDVLAGVDKVEYSVDNKGFSEYISTFSIPNDGETTLSIKGTDKVLNINTQFVFKKVLDESGNIIELKNESPVIVLDNNAPIVEIKADKEFIEKNGKQYASMDFKYTITAADEGAGVQKILYRFDGKGDFKEYSKEVTLTTIVNGAHSIEAIAIDKTGNKSTIKILPFFIDLQPGETTIEIVKE